MANKEHLDRLKEALEKNDISIWNKWRQENRNVRPDLSNAQLSYSNMNYADLTDANLCRAKLHQARLRYAILSGADFSHSDLDFADLTGAILYWTDIRYAHLRAADLSSAAVAAIRYNRWGKYRGIRVESCREGPRFKRFAQDQDFIEDFSAEWRRKLGYWLWLIFADCGRSLLLWTFWCVFMVLIFAYRYWTMGPEAFRHLDLPWQPASAIYYSVVTFTTLGFRDISPRTIHSAMWVMVEVVIGYIMLGGLISIFANKLARRS